MKLKIVCSKSIVILCYLVMCLWHSFHKTKLKHSTCQPMCTETWILMRDIEFSVFIWIDKFSIFSIFYITFCQFKLFNWKVFPSVIYHLTIVSSSCFMEQILTHWYVRNWKVENWISKKENDAMCFSDIAFDLKLSKWYFLSFIPLFFIFYSFDSRRDG